MSTRCTCGVAEHNARLRGTPNTPARHEPSCAESSNAVESTRIELWDAINLFAESRAVGERRELAVVRVEEAVDRLLAAPSTIPVPMLLWCPQCSERHIDIGEFATRPHHTHACQDCGMVWRPAIVPTVGVYYLPGFKNEETSEPVVREEPKR